MPNLEALIGREQPLDEVSRALHEHVRGLRPGAVGALHVTCADETEQECAAAFQRRFGDLLPALKFGVRAPFRLANLGARYESGALAVAEHHYAVPAAAEGGLVLAVKINAHVGVDGEGATAHFGRLVRYGASSTACGALHAMLDGRELPAARLLQEEFRVDGLDRVKLLRAVEARLRGLYVALVHARLQCRRLAEAAARQAPHYPTRYVIVAAVTLNRAARDSELLCGVHTATAGPGGSQGAGEYAGLGDDPRRYRVAEERGRLVVT